MTSCEPGVSPFVMSLIGGDLNEQILTETLRKPKLYVQGAVVFHTVWLVHFSLEHSLS